MRAKKMGLALIFVLLSGLLIAQEILSEQFLEYLGEYEQIDGEWVDPLSFAESLEQMAQIGQNSSATEADKSSANYGQQTTGQEVNNEN